MIINMLFSVLRLFDSLLTRLFSPTSIEHYLRFKGMRVGKNNRLLTKKFGSEPYLIKIGNHVTVSSEVLFLTHDGGCFLFREEIPLLNKFGKIEIKDNCFIGARAIIMPNVTIGPNSVIGAGAIVTKDVPPNAVYAGVPAKFICDVGLYKKKCIDVFHSYKLSSERKFWQRELVGIFWGQ